MGRSYKDLTGKQFGYLTIIKDVGRSKSGDVLWECECSCEEHNHIVTTSSNLQRGHTQSCGCYQKSQNIKAHKKENRFKTTGDVTIGFTSKNEQFFIDTNQLDNIRKYCWWYTKRGYLAAWVDDKIVLMHRFLTQCDEQYVVDHKNHITGDNRMCNLRICTSSENHYNRMMQHNNTSGITGVSWNKSKNMWRSYINVAKERIELGFFTNLDDAIVARRQAEEKYHQDFSLINSLNTEVICNV